MKNLLSSNYRQILCLNLCATQENKERIKLLEDENTTLKTKVLTL